MLNVVLLKISRGVSETKYFCPHVTSAPAAVIAVVLSGAGRQAFPMMQHAARRTAHAVGLVGEAGGARRVAGCQSHQRHQRLPLNAKTGVRLHVMQGSNFGAAVAHFLLRLIGKVLHGAGSAKSEALKVEARDVCESLIRMRTFPALLNLDSNFNLLRLKATNNGSSIF